MYIKVQITGVILDPNTNSYIVLLNDDKREPLPIWVGAQRGMQ